MPIPQRIPAYYSAGLAAVILAPLARPGYLLLRDAVSTPQSYLTDTALGLGDAAPRAVPQDAVLAVVSAVIDGGWAVKLILLCALWFAGWGAAVLVRDVLGVGVGPQVLASTVAIWNPYVAERLLQGHWSLLVAYGTLPWLVWACHGGRLFPIVLCLAAAALTPTGAILAAFVAVVAARTVRMRCVVGLVAVATWLPWLVVSGTGASDPAGVAAFAARAEPGLGTLGSLAGLGGIWNSQAVPGSRACWFAVPATVALVSIVAIGVPMLWRRRSTGEGYAQSTNSHQGSTGDEVYLRRFVVLAAVAVLVPALAATPVGLTAGEWLVRQVPGAGLLRDGQKYVALAMPGYVLAAAAGAAFIARRVGWVAVLGMIAVVVAVLPDLAFGVGGHIRSVQYPQSWQRVSQVPVRGDVAVLPAGMFRTFPYAGTVPVLDPAPRMLRYDVLQTGTLIVGGRAVAGESIRAVQVEQALLQGDSPDRLADLGVGAVLVECTSSGSIGLSSRTLAQLRPAYHDNELALYLVPGQITTREVRARWRAIGAHLIWAALLFVGAVGTGVKCLSRTD